MEQLPMYTRPIRKLRLNLLRWIQDNSFAPEWLPGPLRHPLYGYLVAGLVELAAAVLMLVFTSLAPGFGFHGLLTLVGLVLLAVGWGAGPGVFASIVGVLLLWLVVLPPHFTWKITDLANGIGLLVSLAISITISLLVGGSERARRQAEKTAIEETKTQMDTFLGIAGHELKTPLTTLKLSLQLSQRRLTRLTRGSTESGAVGDDAGLQAAVEQLGRTAHQMERLEALVNDLVDVSRIQAGKLELYQAPTDLLRLVAETVALQREAAPDRHIRLQLPPQPAVEVVVDGGRIEQVLTNYLTNSLKYSPADQPIDVGLQVQAGESGPQVQVWVRDQGPGLPPEDQAHIWERFHRVPGVEVQSGTGVGLGLGLYICRMIVERHHGHVGVHSVPGQGATFWFTLPLLHAT